MPFRLPASPTIRDRSPRRRRLRSQTRGHKSLQFQVLEQRRVLAAMLEPTVPPEFDLRLVADIADGGGQVAGSQETLTLNPIEVAATDNQAFFTANTIDLGTELYVTDGTLAGTDLVADLIEGPASADPGSLTFLGEELYFIAATPLVDPFDPLGGDTGLFESGLWKTAGTAETTTRVHNFGETMDVDLGGSGGPFFAEPSPPMHVVDGKLVFVQPNEFMEEQLWVHDPVAGTTEVLTTFFGPGLVSPGDPMPTAMLGDILLFNRDVDGTGSHSLWRTDGTSVGTFGLQSVFGFDGGLFDPAITVVGSTAYFVSDSGSGYELWKTDGTVAGTTQVKDIHEGSDASSPRHLTNVDGTLFFSADNGFSGGERELWKSDGTEAGTVQVKDIRPDGGAIDPDLSEFAAVGSTLYFVAADSASGDTELWKSDGSEAGTVVVFDAPDGSLFPNELAPLDDDLIFVSGASSPGGRQLWKTSISTGVTELIQDIAASSLIRDGEQVFFTGIDSATGSELWVTDATAIGTSPLGDLNPGVANGLNQILTTGLGGILFRGNDGDGLNLGFSDGTASGTRLLSTPSGTPSAEIEEIFFHDGLIYLSAQEGLWVSDATEGGTRLLKSFPGSFNTPAQFTEHDGAVYFVAQGDTSEGRELWKTDGTSEGTALLLDILPGSDSSHPTLLTSFDGGGTGFSAGLYFVADDGASGAELWRTTGSTETTHLHHEFALGAGDGEIDNISVVGNELYFVADRVLYNSDFVALHDDVGSLMPFDDVLYFAGRDAAHGSELWRTDGTSQGTYLVADIMPGPGSATPFGGLEIGSDSQTEAKLLFGAFAGTNDIQLFSTDGTTAGTLQISDVPTGTFGQSFAPIRFTEVGPNEVYFEAFTAETGRELWRTDGTALGTYLIEDLVAGPSPAFDEATGFPEPFIDEIIGFRDRVFFRRDQSGLGEELYVSDGTADGTGLAIDILTGSGSGNPIHFTE
ncbi:MAG: hypothetical protein AAF670_19545, partial [Planctomycetota bacterium]